MCNVHVYDASIIITPILLLSEEGRSERDFCYVVMQRSFSISTYGVQEFLRFGYSTCQGLRKSSHSLTSYLTWIGIPWHGGKGTLCPNPSIIEKIANFALLHQRVYTIHGTVRSDSKHRSSSFLHTRLLIYLKPSLRVKAWVMIERFIIPQAFFQR